MAVLRVPAGVGVTSSTLMWNPAATEAAAVASAMVVLVLMVLVGKC